MRDQIEKKATPSNIPADAAKPKLPEPMAGQIIKQKKVLFVDDEGENLRLFQVLMRRYKGNKMLDGAFVSSVDAALELLKTQKFDLIFTDFEMPDKNGFELVKEVREKHQDTKITMATGNPIKAQEQAEKMGISVDLLKKPFDTSDFYAKLESLLE